MERTSEMAWVPLAERTPDEHKKARQVLELLGDSSELSDAYEQHKWGLFRRQGTASFYKALTDMERLESFVEPEEWMMKEEYGQAEPNASSVEPDHEYEDEREIDDRDLRSIDWVMKRARSEATRKKARALYQQRLLDLYISHVEHTGETYYPQLRKELILDYCDQNGLAMPE
jgi:hypothetical protein